MPGWSRRPGASEPRYAFAVIVEHGNSGGRAGGPVAAQLIRALAAEGYLGAAALDAHRSGGPSIDWLDRTARSKQASSTPAAFQSPGRVTQRLRSSIGGEDGLTDPVDHLGHPGRRTGSTGPGAFTARELHESARDLQAGRIRWATAAWIVVLAALALNVIGIIAIDTTEPGFARKQAMFLPLGLLVAAIAASPDYRRLRRWVPALCVLVLALLLFVLIPFIPTWLVRPYNGARRWINLGITDLQPSELAKVVWVLALAAWFRLRWNVRSLQGFCFRSWSPRFPWA